MNVQKRCPAWTALDSGGRGICLVGMSLESASDDMVRPDGLDWCSEDVASDAREKERAKRSKYDRRHEKYCMQLLCCLLTSRSCA